MAKKKKAKKNPKRRAAKRPRAKASNPKRKRARARASNPKRKRRRARAAATNPKRRRSRARASNPKRPRRRNGKRRTRRNPGWGGAGLAVKAALFALGASVLSSWANDGPLGAQPAGIQQLALASEVGAAIYFIEDPALMTGVVVGLTIVPLGQILYQLFPRLNAPPLLMGSGAPSAVALTAAGGPMGALHQGHVKALRALDMRIASLHRGTGMKALHTNMAGLHRGQPMRGMGALHRGNPMGRLPSNYSSAEIESDPRGAAYAGR